MKGIDIFGNCQNVIFINNTCTNSDGDIIKLPDFVKEDGGEIELNNVLVEAYTILSSKSSGISHKGG